MTALVLSFLVCAAPAQDLAPLVVEGDIIGGVGSVTSIDNLAINGSGDWLVEATTDAGDSNADQVIMRNFALLVREGDALAQPVGATVDSFDSLSLSEAGDGAFNFFLDGTSGFNDDSGIFLDTTLLIQESDFVDSTDVSPNTPWIGFFDVKSSGGDEMLVVGSVDDSAIPSSVDRVLAILDVTGGSLQSTEVRAKEGDLLPGMTDTVADFGTGPHQSAINSSGDILFFADLTGSTSTDGTIWLEDTLLAREGSPSPVGGRNWSSLASPEVDLGGGGDWVFSGTLDGDSATNLLIVSNDAKFRQEGDSFPAIAPFSITSFGTGPLSISQSGEVLWYGEWDDPDGDIDSGLFVNDELIVQEGVTTVGGVVIDTLRGIQDGYFLSETGDQVIFEAILMNGLDGAFLVDRSLGSRYCSPAVVNSTGVPGVVQITGSDVVTDDDLTLTAAQLPTNSNIGYFIMGTGMNTFVPTGAIGPICVTPGLKRYLGPVNNTNELPGGFSRVVGTSGPISGFITPGSTWNFQAWHRDSMAGTSNLTDALSITFQ